MRDHYACCKRCPSRRLRTDFDKWGGSRHSPEKDACGEQDSAFQLNMLLSLGSLSPGQCWLPPQCSIGHQFPVAKGHAGQMPAAHRPLH